MQEFFKAVEDVHAQANNSGLDIAGRYIKLASIEANLAYIKLQLGSGSLTSIEKANMKLNQLNLESIYAQEVINFGDDTVGKYKETGLFRDVKSPADIQKKMQEAVKNANKWVMKEAGLSKLNLILTIAAEKDNPDAAKNIKTALSAFSASFDKSAGENVSYGDVETIITDTLNKLNDNLKDNLKIKYTKDIAPSGPGALKGAFLKLPFVTSASFSPGLNLSSGRLTLPFNVVLQGEISNARRIDRKIEKLNKELQEYNSRQKDNDIVKTKSEIDMLDNLFKGLSQEEKDALSGNYYLMSLFYTAQVQNSALSEKFNELAQQAEGWKNNKPVITKAENPEQEKQSIDAFLDKLVSAAPESKRQDLEQKIIFEEVDKAGIPVKLKFSLAFPAGPKTFTIDIVRDNQEKLTEAQLRAKIAGIKRGLVESFIRFNGMIGILNLKEAYNANNAEQSLENEIRYERALNDLKGMVDGGKAEINLAFSADNTISIEDIAHGVKHSSVNANADILQSEIKMNSSLLEAMRARKIKDNIDITLPISLTNPVSYAFSGLMDFLTLYRMAFNPGHKELYKSEGYSQYNKGEIDVNSARKELDNGSKLSAAIIEETGLTKEMLGSLKEKALLKSLNKFIKKPDLYTLVDQDSLKLDDDISGLISKIKGQLASDKKPKLTDIRKVNRVILYKAYPGTLEKSQSRIDNLEKEIANEKGQLGFTQTKLGKLKKSPAKAQGQYILKSQDGTISVAEEMTQQYTDADGKVQLRHYYVVNPIPKTVPEDKRSGQEVFSPTIIFTQAGKDDNGYYLNIWEFNPLTSQYKRLAEARGGIETLFTTESNAANTSAISSIVWNAVQKSGKYDLSANLQFNNVGVKSGSMPGGDVTLSAGNDNFANIASLKATVTNAFSYYNHELVNEQVMVAVWAGILDDKLKFGSELSSDENGNQRYSWLINLNEQTLKALLKYTDKNNYFGNVDLDIIKPNETNASHVQLKLYVNKTDGGELVRPTVRFENKGDNVEVGAQMNDQTGSHKFGPYAAANIILAERLRGAIISNITGKDENEITLLITQYLLNNRGHRGAVKRKYGFRGTQNDSG